jgi:hypothetical protein
MGACRPCFYLDIHRAMQNIFLVNVSNKEEQEQLSCIQQQSNLNKRLCSSVFKGAYFSFIQVTN